MAGVRARPRSNPKADFIVSIFMEQIYGRPVGRWSSRCWCCGPTFGSVFALLLGYSRIPYAAAQDGYFFKVFARLHPTKNFPHVSLLVIGRHLDRSAACFRWTW